jgi:DNA-binding LacI/PurR family transcriptional regulator
MPDVNQQTIADQLQLSRATVSRCFTNHPGINPTTRARVFQLAAELGYKHLEMRVPRNRTTAQNAVGVLICVDEQEYRRNPYQNPGERILEGVTECAQLHGTRVDVHLVDPKERSLAEPSYLRLEEMRRRWDGLLLVYPFPDPIINQLAPLLPVVSLVEQTDHSSIDCVDVDHYKGISSVIEHLLGHGHRRIGFFTRRYPVEASWSFRRYAAFMEQMARLRLPVRAKDVISVFPSPELGPAESVQAAVERTGQGVTAWVCAADQQAYELVRGLRKAGLRVPRDVSVTGFDGITPPKDCLPLSTVEIPFREIGTTGTQRLIDRIRRRFGSSQHVLINCRLRVGGTVAPPRC